MDLRQDPVVATERVLRRTRENKVAQAETELVYLKSCQAEMEETYLTADETQECQPAIREEELRTDTTSDEISTEGYPRESQMVQSHKKPRCSEE